MYAKIEPGPALSCKKCKQVFEPTPLDAAVWYCSRCATPHGNLKRHYVRILYIGIIGFVVAMIAALTQPMTRNADTIFFFHASYAILYAIGIRIVHKKVAPWRDPAIPALILTFTVLPTIIGLTSQTVGAEILAAALVYAIWAYYLSSVYTRFEDKFML